MVKYKFGVGDW